MLCQELFAFFGREWTAKDNGTSSLQSAVKGNHTLRHVRQRNHNAITRLETQSLQGMGETIAQEVQLAVTDLLRKEDDGGTIREVPGGIAEHIMHKLLGLRNIFGHVTCEMKCTGPRTCNASNTMSRSFTRPSIVWGSPTGSSLKPCPRRSGAITCMVCPKKHNWWSHCVALPP